MFKTRTQLVATENRNAQFGEVFIAAGVIAMHMRIDQEADWFVRDLLDGRHQSVGERRKL